MTMKTIYYKITCCTIAAIAICAISACSNSEGDLTPSGDALTYKLPQGNNDYDQTIVDFYNKYGTYILYQFNDKDAYWTPSGWKNGAEGAMSAGGKQGYLVKASESANIKQQLSLLKEVWFDSYTDKFLKAYLPAKILLCSEIDSIVYDWSSYPFKLKGVKIGAWYNYYNICTSYGNSDVNSMTATDKRIFKDKINRVFIQSIIERAIVTLPDEFTSATNYTGVLSISDNTKLWARGTFPDGYSATPLRDWGFFMRMMVCHTYDFLSTPPAYIDTYDTSEASWEGILSPEKDVNGIIKKRYDMVRNYYIKNYDIDLQNIGNHIND